MRVPFRWASYLEALLALIPKSGGRHNLGKYRATSLLQQCNKLVTPIITRRLQTHLGKFKMESQSGLRLAEEQPTALFDSAGVGAAEGARP